MVSGIGGGKGIPAPQDMAKKFKGFVVDDPWDKGIDNREVVVVADRVKRTAKFLSILNRGC